MMAADTRSIPARDISPTPSLSPIPAISSCPSPDRTFSSVSSVSNKSSTSNSSASRRRGYVRPQGATFAESARHRESVMCLGSIAHLQHYFARTGLLDGKGGRSKAYKKKDPFNMNRLFSSGSHESDIVESPIDESGFEEDWDLSDEEMLPPTVSTYSRRERRIPPPPDVEVLRLDLQAALDEAEREISSEEKVVPEPHPEQNNSSELKIPKHRSQAGDTIEQQDEHLEDSDGAEAFPEAPMRSNYEIHGVRCLHLITSAIACAKTYYTSHDRPERLKLISPERKIRKDLLNVLEILKLYVSRNFDGGLKDKERAVLLDWCQSARYMVEEDRRLEEQEHQRRKNLTWANGDWTGREREREHAFLSYLETTGQPLPPWTPVDEETPADTDLPTPFLSRVRDGRDLVRFHNEAVRQSKRRFGEIKTYHQDIGKPYRQTENLLFFVKACEIRWETKLDVDVSSIVNDTGPEAWRKFDAALMTWCRVVREELVRDWGEMEAEKKKAKTRHSLGPDGLASLMSEGFELPQ
ncbi:hypothetical protein KEM56_006725 [Ascosphaera pollenicola]|nr:hypothetical protein KEM56_006725 [Ascosphaera pollenicola]